MKRGSCWLALCSLCTALIAIIPIQIQAQVSVAPAKMTFQGRLTKPDGTPVSDGTYSVRFSLHDALAGGNEKWSQTLANVTVRNGTFAALLDVNTASLFAGDLYLEIKLGNDAPLTPRQPLVSVPYALKANTVPDGSIGASQIANGSITSDKFASDALNNLSWLLGGNTGTNPVTHFLGTADNQPLLFKTNNVERLRMGSGGGLFFPGAFGANPDYVGSEGNFLAFGHGGVSEDALSYKNNTFFFKEAVGGGDTADPNVVVGGNLGLGTDTPTFPLSFANSLGDKISLWSGGGETSYGLGIQGGQLQIHGDNPASDITFGHGSSAAMIETMRIKGSGNVGIGTNDPQAKLHVNGTAALTGSNMLEFGQGVVGKQQDAGKIGYQVFSNGLDIIGAGAAGNRRIKLWAEGGTQLTGSLFFPDGTSQSTASTAGWSMTGNSGTNPATHFIGTSDSQPVILRANNRRAMQYSYAESESMRGINVLGGAPFNTIAANVTAATIAGGGSESISNGALSPNRVNASGGTIGGGVGNMVDTIGAYGTVSGGAFNTASSIFATVAGGNQNTATWPYSTVSGGFFNTASGQYAAVAGGVTNTANGIASFAAGQRAVANHDNSFVWSDSTYSISDPNGFQTTNHNQFLVNARGGVGINTNSVGSNQVVVNAPGGIFTIAPGFGINTNNTYGWELYVNGGIFASFLRVDRNLRVDGDFRVTSLPFGDRRNVQWDETTGQFFYDNSSRRHKENITPLQDDFFKLLKAEPRTYTRPSAPNRWEIGFIAEEFDELGLKKLVDYGKNGEVEGINYEKICVYLTAIARQQEDRLKAQEARMKTQDGRVQSLETENAELKKRLDALTAAVERITAGQK